MDWLRHAGAFGQVVVVSSVSLIIAAILAVTRGCTQRAAITLLVASALPFVVGMFAWFEITFGGARPLEAPTPRDFGERIFAMTLGVAGSAVSGLLALVAFLRTSKPEGPPSIEP